MFPTCPGGGTNRPRSVYFKQHFVVLMAEVNPLVFIKRTALSIYCPAGECCGLGVKQSGLFRADYPKHVSSPQGLDGPLCHSVSKPAVQSLLCTALHYEVNTYGGNNFLLLIILLFFTSIICIRAEISSINYQEKQNKTTETEKDYILTVCQSYS